MPCCDDGRTTASGEPTAELRAWRERLAPQTVGLPAGTVGDRDSDPDEPRGREAAHAGLLAAVAGRDPGRAVQAVIHHLDVDEQIAQQGISAVAD
ncbi:hypothetical protein [Streptomyces sp. NPDC005017]|uniref:hypothetical protein n=1 Tax=Streptomyces sp. NPDC005017 TaxID=3364706 RepID=UPI00368EC9BC